MISTRLHGVIDYAVSALMAGASAGAPLPPRLRRALAAAGAYHTSYAVLTDYEAGVVGALSMRQHLALDAVGAGALCLAGVLMRDQPWWARAALFGVGLSELAIIAASEDRQDGDRPPRPSYPPLDTPKLAAPDVFVVDSALSGAKGRLVATRMTVLRLPDGDLVLHSPTRFSERLKQELERRGRIRHLVAPSFGHWMFLASWQRACPEATSWAAPGLRSRRQVRRSRVRFDAELTGNSAAAFGPAIQTVTIPGGMGFSEVALFHEPSRTLVLTDLVQNLEPRKLPAPLRPLMRLIGMTAPGGTTPRYLRLLLDMKRREAAEAATQLIALEPERVIFAHGDWFERDGAASLRRALRWLLEPTMLNGWWARQGSNL